MSFGGTSSICVLCTSQPSITSCEGCQRKYCLTCLSRHRNELSLELDDLFNRRNELVEIMNNHIPSNTTDRYPCFDEINRWENEMHTNITRIASTVRDNVRQLLSETSKNVRKELDQISQDLQQRQKTGGYVEGDLNRIKQQLNKLNDLVQRSNEQIRIDSSMSKNIVWDSLLFVIPNKETSYGVPSSSNLYSSFNRSKNFNLIIQK
jgi:gluconate kinase